jgi:hypothetical protein
MRQRGAAANAARRDVNPMEREALKLGRNARTALNINCLRQSCGKLAATEFAQFFLRPSECFFAADAWRREKRGRHGLAENFPRICHAAVRLDSYAAFSRASSNSKSK